MLVASDSGLLAKDAGDLWDSGRVASDASVMVPYDGKPLRPRRTFHWKVRGWDEKGEMSDWSKPARWTTAMLGEAWPGKYIGLSPSDGDPEFPLLRKKFSLERNPVTARLYVNALGYYEAYCNGRKIDDHVLMPAVSQYGKRSLYVVHDVTDLCGEGENVLGLWLGRGWYVEGLPGVAHAGPVVRAFLEAKFSDADNEVVRIPTDETWRGHPSHYSRIGIWRGNNFGGERVDGRQRLERWASPGFDAVGWPAVATPDIPEHSVCAQEAEPNRVTRTLHPRSIQQDEGDSVWTADLGRNVAGLFSMRFRGLAPGQEVRFEFADDVRSLAGEDGIRPCSEYIAKGEGEEVFENRFNYHGFRYVRIVGLDKAPEREDLTASLVRTDFTKASAFRCSNPLLNGIHDMISYTLECLSLGGYLVDCPHIERLGYGGDGLASAPTAMKMHNMGAFYRNWMNAWRDCQRPDGDLPHTAPNPYKAGGGPFWCAFVVGAPWYAYLHYGDKRILEDNYATMQLWLDGYVQGHLDDKGLLMGWPNPEYRNWYLGDWAMPDRRELELDQSLHLVVNCSLVQCHEWMAKIAGVLDKRDDQTRYAAEGDRLRRCVHEKFYDAEKGTYADDMQLDLAYPLLVDVPPEEIRAKLVDKLARKIRIEHDGHLDVGLVGVSILTQALTKCHRNDLVFAYVNKKTYPGWGYMLENGATTTWEHWDAKRSRIHNCYNGVGEWFYQAIGGIQPNADSPGWKEYTLRPSFVGDVDHAQAHMDTPYGTIKSEWRMEGNELCWNVRVPANTAAEVRLPLSCAGEITEGGLPLARADGVGPVRMTAEEVSLRLCSGNYELRVPRP